MFKWMRNEWVLRAVVVGQVLFCFWWVEVGFWRFRPRPAKAPESETAGDVDEEKERLITVPCRVLDITDDNCTVEFVVIAEFRFHDPPRELIRSGDRVTLHIPEKKLGYIAEFGELIDPAERGASSLIVGERDGEVR